MPNLLGILETALYVDQFERACAFYEQVLGLNSIYRDARLCAYDVGGRGVLLLFLRGASLETMHMPGGAIPPHDGQGPVHMALSVAADELAGLGGAARGRRCRNRRPHQMAARRRKHLPPRPRRAFARTRDAGPVAGLLGRHARVGAILQRLTPSLCLARLDAILPACCRATRAGLAQRSP
jgi:hypothetical protein